jgi:hypothetical protein
MYTPKLEPNIGWIVVDETGEPYAVDGAVQAGLREWAEALAGRLNGES